MTLGPVQMMVLGFAEPNFTGKIAPELDRLREHEFVRIVDALVVQKDDDGNVTALQTSDLSQDEAMEMGAIAGALIGFGFGEDDEAVEAGAELGTAAHESVQGGTLSVQPGRRRIGGRALVPSRTPGGHVQMMGSRPP